MLPEWGADAAITVESGLRASYSLAHGAQGPIDSLMRGQAEVTAFWQQVDSAVVLFLVLFLWGFLKKLLMTAAFGGLAYVLEFGALGAVPCQAQEMRCPL